MSPILEVNICKWNVEWPKSSSLFNPQYILLIVELNVMFSWYKSPIELKFASERLCYYTTALFCFCYYIKHITGRRSALALKCGNRGHAQLFRACVQRAYQMRTEKSGNLLLRRWQRALSHFNGHFHHIRVLMENVLPVSTELVLMWNSIQSKTLINLWEYNFLFWWID